MTGQAAVTTFEFIQLRMRPGLSCFIQLALRYRLTFRPPAAVVFFPHAHVHAYGTKLLLM